MGEELERLPSGRFPKGVSGNPGGKRRDPSALQIQKLAARMTPAVLLKLKRVVDAIDPAKPTTAAIKAAEMIVNRAHGEPVSEVERMNFDLARSDVRFTFSMTDTGAEALDGDAIEETAGTSTNSTSARPR